MLVTENTNIFSLAEAQEIFQHLMEIIVYCQRCQLEGNDVILELGRCPRCFELWEVK